VDSRLRLAGLGLGEVMLEEGTPAFEIHNSTPPGFLLLSVDIGFTTR